MKKILPIVIGFVLSFTSQAQNLLWGTSFNGGTSSAGVIFQYDPVSSTILKKMDFDNVATGKNPTGSLVKGADEKLYGLTISGGVNNKGVLFQYDPNTSTFTKKVDFDGTLKGANPYTQLLKATDGKLYGVTSIGGVNNKGVLFQYDPATSTFAKKIDFDGTLKGANPIGALMQATDGKLYGMTSSGGTNNKGVFFQYDLTTSTFTKKLDFNGSSNGCQPYGSLKQATDGKLYGMTTLGGTNDKGVLFQYNLTTSTYTKKIDFDGSSKGAKPYGTVIQASDGNLYAMTSLGGTNNLGVIFQYNISTSTYTKKLNFSGSTNGSKPYGSFTQATDGKLYGTTTEGGLNSLGTLFQYNFTTSTYTKKFDFNGAANGSNPVDLIEASAPPTITTLAVTATNCAGNTIAVPYTATGTFNAGNIFTAQLSNASGSFASPVTIGTLASTTSGSISATLPGSTPSGTAYRIRVISSNPAVTGNDNGSNITINALPTVTANATATTICTGTNVTLTGAGADTYAWTGGVTDGVAFTPAATDTYTVTGTDANGCTNTASITIAVNALPVVVANVTASTICTGTNVTLTGSGATTYTWTGGVTDGVAFTPAATDTYSVTGTDANGCTNTASITITVNPVPAQPGAFTTSSSSVNRGQNAVAYTIPNDPAVTYTWSYSGAGATINGSGNSITIDFSQNATGGTLSVIASNGCTSIARTIAISIGTTGPNSSQSPYLLPTIPAAQFTSILTAADAVGGYKMCGIPDGLGAFDNGNGTFTLLMNHEIGNTGGVVRAHGSKGAFVSKWIVNKSNLAVVSGSDLIQTVKLWNGSGYTSYNSSTPSPLTAFNRFCSADLPATSAFYNSATGLGTQARIFMNGEEAGNEGRALAHIVTGTEAGTSYELPYLGKLSWENSVACPFTGDKTVVACLDDSTPGQVYFYVGTKTNTGNDIDKAGLTNGKLFGIAVTGLSTETSGSVPAPNSPFTLADLGQVQNLTGAVINTNSNNAGVTTFLRPEDGAWDPAHPGDFYFVTTNAFNSPSRLWKAHFTNIANPELGGTITAVLDGTEGQQMLDNMGIDNSGHILLQEDVGGNAHLGKTWQYTIATDELKQVGTHDPTRFLNGAPNFLTQDEEASGMIDVQTILGPGMFLSVDQAHYGIPGEVVEGGQLLAYYNPDSYAANPEIAFKGNNVNIVDGDVTPSVTDSTHVGIVTIGQSRTTNYLIQNTGTGSLIISGINFAGANASEFSVVGVIPTSIAPSTSATIAVKFTPTVVGNRTAIINILNNDLDESTFDVAFSGTATDQPTAPSSSQSPYLLPTIPSATFTAMLTANDAIGGYKMCGLPDGLGAYDNNNGTFTILMNHEMGNSAGAVHAHGSKGAFVSKWIVNKSNLAVVSGSDLIQTVKLWNGSGYTSYNSSTPSPLTAFTRFCSADLPATSAFYNSATGLGTQERIFMNGEEAGNEGRAFAHIVTGTEAGTTYELPYLGKLSFENAVACPFTGDKTVVAGLDDSTPGQVYFYIGTKTNTGSDIDKAGLTNGKLFGIAVTGLSTETSGSVPAPNSPFTLADLGQVQNLTGAVINTNSNNAGVTTFLRPEDGAWDPAHPGDFYFVTTNAFNSPSRLWKAHFNNIANPELGGTITAVLDGTEGQQMMDNIGIDISGHIFIQEDVGGNAHLGKTWQYTIATDELKQVGTHDPTRFLNGAPNFLTQDEEASGIIDVQNILGPGMFLTVDQAHYAIAGEVVEGGQLLAYYNPDSYTAAPLAYTVNGGGSYCQGDTTGLPVGLSNSQTSVNYQLIKNDTIPVGTPIAGTGSPVSFGNQTATGTYTIIATSTINSSTTAMTGSVMISVNPIPTVAITAGGETNFCAGDSVLLTATSGAGVTYLWSTGATTQTIAVDTTGSYTVVLTDANGCSSAPSTPVNITTHTIDTDFNYDGKVTNTDLGMFLLLFGTNCSCPMDLNHDGKVTNTDLGILLLQFGKTCNGQP